MHSFRVWGAVVLLLAVESAQGGLLPVHVGVAREGTDYRYTYSVMLESDTVLKPGDYFTVYDFAGLVNGANLGPANFAYSTSNSGPTPTGVLPSDDPNVANLTWTYTGAQSAVGQLALGDFSAKSRYGSTRDDSFTGQTHRTVDGHLNSNITDTQVPVPTAHHCGVPEPTSIALLALGIPFALGARALRRRIA